MLLISRKAFIDLIQQFHISFKLAYAFDINKLFNLLNTIISYNFLVGLYF